MKPQTEESYKERVLRVLVHIQGHLDEALRLEDLAAVAYFSPYHFHRVFRGMVGESVKEHVRRLRLERAALRLKHAAEPVTRIAFEPCSNSRRRSFAMLIGPLPCRRFGPGSTSFSTAS